MSFVVPEEIERYAEAHTTPTDDLLHRLAEETRATLESPQMLTGPIEGRFLQFLVFISGARRVLELGTYSGYSAISMAAALPAGGHVDTCEVDERHAAVATRYVKEAGYADRISIHVGPALETIDADKVNYGAYYDALVPRLAERGVMAIDNTLWSGKVLEPDDDAGTRAIAELNDRIAADADVVAVQLTIRDGVTLVRRR